jgi:hypothetical protein
MKVSVPTILIELSLEEASALFDYLDENYNSCNETVNGASLTTDERAMMGKLRNFLRFPVGRR